MNIKQLIKGIIITILIILLGIIDYHVSCVYLDYVNISKDLRLSIKSLEIVYDLTIFLLFLKIGIVSYIIYYKKTKITLIYPKNNI